MYLVKRICSKFKCFVIITYSILGILFYTSIVVILTRRDGDSIGSKDFYTQEKKEDNNDLRLAISNVTSEKRSTKILCYILLSRKKVAAAKVISETWGSRCDKLLFFGRFKSSDLKITFLNATEGYAYLWGKTKAAILHLDREYSNDYDWFIKADDDTFLIVDNLRGFVSDLNSSRPLWLGYKLRDKNMREGYLSGGAGYVFSKAGVHNIAILLEDTSNQIPSSSCDRTGEKGYEDLELGKCAILAGIEEVISTDTSGRERFLPMPLSSLLNSDVSKFHWIWSQSWNSVKLGEKCCSQDLISIHQIPHKEMKTLYYLIYELKVNRRPDFLVPAA